MEAKKMRFDEAPHSSQAHDTPQYVINISNLSKSFRKSGAAAGHYTTIKSLFADNFRRAFSKQTYVKKSEIDRTIQALSDITLKIPRGSSVGIIGRNGSGKSTLLKVITGIYKPTTGTVQVLGSMAALIELGAGFHPDFTGRENVILGGVMQGLKRSEVEALLPKITEFAELENYIDEPVRTYSSGMFMRLGFSLSVHLEPEILLVDEVLAVGDAGFNRKCKERIEQMRKKGITLLMVTHDLDAVERWCDEALWLHSGEVKDRGDPRRVIDAYRQFIESEEEKELVREDEALVQEDEPLTSEDVVTEANDLDSVDSEEARRWGSREVEILSVTLKNADKEAHQLFHPDDGLTIEVEYRCHQKVTQDLVFGIGIERNDGTPVFGTNTFIEGWDLCELPDKGTFVFKIPRLPLAAGRYKVDVAAHRVDGYPYDYHKGVSVFAVRVEKNRVGVIDPELDWDVRS